LDFGSFSSCEEKRHGFLSLFDQIFALLGQLRPGGAKLAGLKILTQTGFVGKGSKQSFARYDLRS
jgi:hypothetical protein